MSTLWTPDGERPIRRPVSPPPASPAGGPGGAPGRPGPDPSAQAPGAGHSEAGDDGEPLTGDDAAAREELERLQRELAEAPAEVVIANHAVGLFNLAGLHLSQQPPQLDQARLAIDALTALLDGLAGRLGSDEPALRDGLSQLRLAFVQISGESRAGPASS